MSSNHKHACCTMLQKTKQQHILDHLDPAKTHLSSPIHIISSHIWILLSKKNNHFPYGNFSSAALDETRLPTVPLARPKASSKASRLPSARCSSCKRWHRAPGWSGPRVGLYGVWWAQEWMVCTCLKFHVQNHPNGCTTFLKTTFEWMFSPLEKDAWLIFVSGCFLKVPCRVFWGSCNEGCGNHDRNGMTFHHGGRWSKNDPNQSVLLSLTF